jgi:hypothetical protein
LSNILNVEMSNFEGEPELGGHKDGALMAMKVARGNECLIRINKDTRSLIPGEKSVIKKMCIKKIAENV